MIRLNRGFQRTGRSLEPSTAFCLYGCTILGKHSILESTVDTAITIHFRHDVQLQDSALILLRIQKLADMEKAKMAVPSKTTGGAAWSNVGHI